MLTPHLPPPDQSRTVKDREEAVQRGGVTDTTSRVTQGWQKDNMGVRMGNGTLSCGHQKPSSPWLKQAVGLQNQKASGVFRPRAQVYPELQTVPRGACVSLSLVQLGGMLSTLAPGLG